MLKLKELAKSRKVLNKFIAEILDISESMVSYHYKAKHLSFNRYIDMLDLICLNEKEVYEYIIEWCKVIDKKDFIKDTIEWCSNTGNTALMQTLIKRGKDLSKEKDKDIVFYELYELLGKRNEKKEKKIDKVDFYIQCGDLKAKGIDKTDTNVLMTIAEMYAAFDLNSLQIVFIQAEQGLKKLVQVDEGYRKDSFELRLKEFVAISHKKRNEIKQAKELALSCLTEKNKARYPLVYNSLLCLLGELYIFDDYKKSISYIRSAIELIESLPAAVNYEYRMNGLKATHDFTKIVNEDFSDLYLEDKAELAHYYASQPDKASKKKALELIEEIKVENKGVLTPFQSYYLAVASEDIKLMEEAIKHFSNSGNTHYSTVAHRKLLEFKEKQ